jgi:gluconokinase
MKSPFILALDIGTSSVRAALYDAKGDVLPETMVKNERSVIVTGEGGAELDAETAFGQVETAIRDVLKKCPAEAREIEYAAASCFWHSLVGIDRDGNAATPVYTWAETRPAKYVEVLREKLDETKIHNRTGARFHSSFWAAKLLWLQKERREIFRKTAKWLSFSDFFGNGNFRHQAKHLG